MSDLKLGENQRGVELDPADLRGTLMVSRHHDQAIAPLRPTTHSATRIRILANRYISKVTPQEHLLSTKNRYPSTTIRRFWACLAAPTRVQGKRTKHWSCFENVQSGPNTNSYVATLLLSIGDHLCKVHLHPIRRARQGY
jgi:hypothetical protein